MKLFGEAHGLKSRMGDALGAANSEHALALVLLSLGRIEDARALPAAPARPGTSAMERPPGESRQRSRRRTRRTPPLTASGFIFGGIILVVLNASGTLWAAGAAVFPGCTWWIPAIWVYGSAARASRLPRFAEFDGQVLKRWTQPDGATASTTASRSTTA
jgi:hypothetical protein